MEQGLFRKKTMEKISSPEQLSDYLKVINPEIWLILGAVVALLIGLISWSAVGILETKVEAKAVVNEGKAIVFITNSNVSEIKVGMPIRIVSQEEVAISSLDNITQKRVSEALDKMGCTRIVVAQRLSTIRNCNRIVVLDGGKIIEDGTYDELIKKGGFFAELVERQRV